jgi:hypothetical protein
MRADLLHRGDARIGIEDRAQIAFECLELGGTGDLGLGLGVAFAHPVQGLGILDGFQPEVGIFRYGGLIHGFGGSSGGGGTGIGQRARDDQGGGAAEGETHGEADMRGR